MKPSVKRIKKPAIDTVRIVKGTAFNDHKRYWNIMSMTPMGT